MFGRPHGASDRGDVILGWLTKLAIFVAVVGLAGFDAVSIGASKLGAADDADNAAEAAALNWVQTHKIQLAYDAAMQVADQHGEVIPPKSFTIAPDGTVNLTVVRNATTLVVRRIGPLRHFQVVREHGTASPPAA